MNLVEGPVECRTCPRLVSWCEQVGRDRRAAFRDETNWARPVPGFGDFDATIVAVGPAHAAHALGAMGFASILESAVALGWVCLFPNPGNRVEVQSSPGPLAIGCYHPSQQDTFTGRLTRDMLVEVLTVAAGRSEFPLSP